MSGTNIRIPGQKDLIGRQSHLDNLEYGQDLIWASLKEAPHCPTAQISVLAPPTAET